eukprot:scaffold719_cov359-Prasinococcus_capsulatus_cf.AAC.5
MGCVQTFVTRSLVVPLLLGRGARRRSLQHVRMLLHLRRCVRRPSKQAIGEFSPEARTPGGRGSNADTAIEARRRRTMERRPPTRTAMRSNWCS